MFVGFAALPHALFKVIDLDDECFCRVDIDGILLYPEQLILDDCISVMLPMHVSTIS